MAASTTAFQNDLRGKYDVIIMYDFSRDLDDKGKKNLRDFVESGKGIVVLASRAAQLPEVGLVVPGRGRRQLSPVARGRRSVVDRQERPGYRRDAGRGRTRSPRASSRFTSSMKPTVGCGSRRTSGRC